MDVPQRNMTAATGREDDELQQRQREEGEEGERATSTMRDRLTSIRIQTRISDPQAASRQQEDTKAEQQQHDQDYPGVTMEGGGNSVLSAQSDMSDRTVFDWQVQDHHRHYPSMPSFTASATGDEERHATPGIEVRHGKDKWAPPPPPPLLSLPSNQDLKRQQRYSTTQYQQSQSWSATTATASPRNWARQTRIWLSRYFSTSIGTPLSGHHPQQRQFDQRHSAFGSDDSPLASALTTSSTSTLLGDGGFHSRHHPYFQKGHRHSGSTSSVASSATFLSPGDMESARFKKEQHFWRSSLTLQWTINTPRSLSLSFRLPGLWNIFGGSRSRTSPLTSFSSSSTSSACLRLFTRRRKRTLLKWVWAASLMLVMTLGVYIIIVGISRVHGYLAGDSSSGKNEDLVSTGREVWRRVAMGKIGTIGNVGQGDFAVELDAGKTTATKQMDVVPSSATGVQDQAATTPSGHIWIRRAEDEMDDPLDFYPDEDEDDPLEAASFISWLAQASFTAPTNKRQQDQQQQQRRLQQYQEYPEPARPPPRHQQQTGQEPLLELERYFTYMPFAGISNQFYGMLRAMSIARALDRTLILPPITSSSHDKSRQNQAWSDFFDLNEFRRRTGLKVVEYQDLRDQGSFRGPTGVQESGSSVGASWVPPWAKEAAAATESKDKRGDRYQHSLGTGTAAVDMTMPCHSTCGFGSKRDLDFTAKAFVRQWGFQYKKLMLPKSPPPPPTPPGSTSQPLVPIDTSPIDQTRDLDRIVAALQDASLKTEGFLCVSNTYKIQISPAAIPAGSLVDSIEWQEFGQHLLFQPKLTQFVNEFLDRTFGEHPEERTMYANNTFWISPQAPSAPPPIPSPFPEPVLVSPSPPQVDSPHLVSLVQPIVVAVDTPPSPPQSLPIPVSYAASVDLTPWPPLRPLIHHTFFMIHVRRGDFEAYCKKDIKSERFYQCLPSNEAYANVIDELQQRALKVSDKDGLSDEVERSSRRKGGQRRRIPVLVATNENRPEELAQLRQLGRSRRVRNLVVDNEQAVAEGGGAGGVVLDVESEGGAQGREGRDAVASGLEEEESEEEWIILDHEEMRTVERLGVFGPMMVEQLLMAEAEALVGVRMSTFSRVGGYRQRDWYHRRILYM